MRMLAEIGQNEVKLSLVSGKTTQDCLIWKENNSLSRILLGSIDKLLNKNGIGLDKISDYKIISDVPQKWTSVRIAKITFETLGLAGTTKISLHERSGG